MAYNNQSYSPYRDALESLKKLQMGYTADVPESAFTQSEIDDPRAQAYALQTQRERELARNVASGGTGPQGEAALTGLRQDIAESPITLQRPIVEETEAANRDAIMKGFTGGTPQRIGQSKWTSEPAQQPAQQLASFLRAQEVAKTNAPLEQSRIEAEGGIAKQKAANEGALAVAKTRAEQMADVITNARLGGGGINRISIPGVGSISMQTNTVASQRVPPAIWNTYQKAQEAVERSTSMLGNPGQAEVIGLRAAAKAMADNYIANDEIRQMAQGYATDPKAAGRSSLEAVRRLKTKHPEIEPGDLQDFQSLYEFYQAAYGAQ